MRRFHPKLLPLSGALMSALLGMSAPRAGAQALAAGALPANGQVIAGSASMQQSGATLSVHQASQRLVTHWDSFNIGSGARVEFVQPSASAVALNRVLSSDPSRIHGQLSANGQVFLVNPAGVLFGPGSRVNVGGLVASTLDISNADFLAGRDRFTGPGPGEVVNEGSIQTTTGGHAVLLGSRVRNTGSISAPGGSIALVSAPSVTLDLHGDGLISVEVDGASANALAANAGALRADGGLVLLAARGVDPMATVVNNSGTIHATTLTQRNGVVRLEGGDAGIVRSSGVIDVSGRDAGQTGGSVQLLGDKVGLFDAARVDASGSAGGGTVLLGGDWQGGGSAQRASASYVGPDARIAADATGAGDGGKVVVWSDGSTRFEGAISARGAGSGQGGMAEVSGRQFLDFAGSADLGAVSGRVGELLLDPTNITISTGTNGATLSGEEFTGSGTSTILNRTTLLNQLANSNVTVSTASAGGGAGDITLSSALAYTGANARTLTLRADRDVVLNASITSSNAALNVVLNAGAAAAGSTGSVSMSAGSQVVSNGGNITIGGGPGAGGAATGGAVSSNGFRMLGTGASEAAGTLLSAGAGNIVIQAASPSASGLSMQNTGFNTITTTTGNISITSTGTGSGNGINLSSGTNTIRTTSGNITLTGTSSGSGAGVSIASTGTHAITTTSGTITINGTSATGSGVSIAPTTGSAKVEATGAGNVAITGTASGSSAALALSGGAQVRSTGGTITLSGTNSGGTGFSMGSGTNIVQADAGGSVGVTGRSTSTGSGFGISIGSGGTNSIRAATGAVQITGASAGSGSAISLGSGTNTIEATGAGGSVTVSAASTGSANALSMGTAGANTLRTADGNLSVTGSASGGGHGISMTTGTNLVEAGGSGTLAVSGTGSASSGGSGVTMGSGGTNTLRSVNGALSLRGQSTGNASAVTLGSGTNKIEATGSGSLSVEGNSAASNGVSLASNGTNTISATSGSLSITGTGGGSFGDGVVLGSGTVTVETTTGAIHINGTASGGANGVYADSSGTARVRTASGSITFTGASGTGTALAFQPEGGTVQIQATGAGNISFKGDSYDATPVGGGSVAISSAGGELSIAPLTKGVTIGAGEGAYGTLNWSAAEISQVQGFSLVRIGNSESGALDLRPPWFPFPVVRPSAFRTSTQQALEGTFAVVQELAGAETPRKPAPLRHGTARMRLAVEGFDEDDDGRKKK